MSRRDDDEQKVYELSPSELQEVRQRVRDREPLRKILLHSYPQAALSLVRGDGFCFPVYNMGTYFSRSEAEKAIERMPLEDTLRRCKAYDIIQVSVEQLVRGKVKDCFPSVASDGYLGRNVVSTAFDQLLSGILADEIPEPGDRIYIAPILTGGRGYSYFSGGGCTVAEANRDYLTLDEFFPDCRFDREFVMRKQPDWDYEYGCHVPALHNVELDYDEFLEIELMAYFVEPGEWRFIMPSEKKIRNWNIAEGACLEGDEDD